MFLEKFKEFKKIKKLANAIRVLSVETVSKAHSGHSGAPLGQADILAVLFAKHLKFNVKQPDWFGRDRFVLSCGHASAGLYSALCLMGYDDVSVEQLKNFRQLGSNTAGHPEVEKIAAVEVSTGPLGQGIANAVGFALAEKIARAKFGADFAAGNFTYVLMGDGCLMEGLSEEAISFAGHHKLDRLVAIWDDNHITIDGNTALATSTDMRGRFEANGWQVLEIDGHNLGSIDVALSKARKGFGKPCLIIAKTDIGKFSEFADSEKAHGSVLSEEACAKIRAQFGFGKFPVFELPNDVWEFGKSISRKFDTELVDWNFNFKSASKEFKNFVNRNYKTTDEKISAEVLKWKKSLKFDEVATRDAFGKALATLHSVDSSLLGGAADLTSVCKTFAPDMKNISPENADGNYIHYGIREHFMAACMNSLALYGFKPYGATFLTFFDYLKPALRLSAMMKIGVSYVFTHDSIGVGEDGPTHQPVEHLGSLRAIPNFVDLRPCDEVEVAECLELSLTMRDEASALILSRQIAPFVRGDSFKVAAANLCAQGAYRIYGDSKKPALILLASGTEVALAVDVAKKIEADSKGKKSVAVVSMPSFTLFDRQKDTYKKSVLPDGVKVVAIEAARGFELYKYADDVIGVNDFGQSAPYKDVYKFFDLTVEKIVTKIEGGVVKTVKK